MTEIKNFDLLKERKDSLADNSLLEFKQKDSGSGVKKDQRKNLQEIEKIEDIDQLQKDPLTGLYNRDFILTQLEDSIAANEKLSVFYLDLNSFKLINDIHGHDVGDVVLEEVGRRLQTLQDDRLIFGRMGGDEFIALCKDTDDKVINSIGFKIHDVLLDKIRFNTFDYEVSVSIGVARFPIDGDDGQELIKLADTAMYQAKKKKLKDLYLITPAFTKRINQRRKIEKLLRKFDPEQALFLHFQPIFNNNTGKLEGVEALVRWDQAEEGIIEPNLFIPVAEKMGIVQFITRWVFVNAIHQIKEWNEYYGLDLYVSLNLSINCVYNPMFFNNLKEMIRLFKVAPNWITIELTEFAAMHSPHYVTSLLRKISELGVKIAIDDYGTGCSSLLHLKNFGVDFLKIDQTFVEKICQDEKYKMVVNAIIQMAHHMQLSCIAEGVETAEQYTLLKDMGCGYAQGFYLGHPVSAAQFQMNYFEKLKSNDEYYGVDIKDKELPAWCCVPQNVTK